MKNKKEDNLRSAKGIFFGMIISIIFWLFIGLLIFFIYRIVYAQKLELLNY